MNKRSSAFILLLFVGVALTAGK